MKVINTIENAQGNRLRIIYTIFPHFEGDDEPDFNFEGVFNREFDNKDDAIYFSKDLLLRPELVLDILNEQDAYIPLENELEKLKTLHSVFVQEALLLDEHVAVDYIFTIASVSKDDINVVEDEEPCKYSA